MVKAPLGKLGERNLGLENGGEGRNAAKPHFFPPPQYLIQVPVAELVCAKQACRGPQIDTCNIPGSQTNQLFKLYEIIRIKCINIY